MHPTHGTSYELALVRNQRALEAADHAALGVEMAPDAAYTLPKPSDDAQKRNAQQG